MVVYLFAVGLDKADKVGSSIGGVLALIALVAPYLLPQPRRENPMPDDPHASDTAVEDSGDAQAAGGGTANTGAEAVDDNPGVTRVSRSGNAVAEGPGSVANTGIRRVPGK
ncbi:hypothetical protein [Amycolatopsis sp. NPDC052450]|uniref:hypothetical protein n=1 Tax=Amycolatopsis sp. NPDC052450 TaxID=3363937 RepID=UPI0037C55150